MTVPSFVIFDVLQLVALACLLVPFTVAIFSKSITRMRTWYHLLFSCIIYSISFLLLLGNQSDKRYPPLALCTFQAGLIYAAPPAVGAASLAFNIELYWTISYLITGRMLKDRRITLLLFFAPVVHITVFVVSVVYGLSDLSSIQRASGGTYCHIITNLPTHVTGGFAVGFVIISTIIQAYTVYVLFKRRIAFNEVRRNAMFPASLLVRVGIYTIIGIIGIIIAIRFSAMNENAKGDTVLMYTLAIIPLSVALMFGSQKDIFCICFCIRAKSPLSDDVKQGK